MASVVKTGAVKQLQSAGGPVTLGKAGYNENVRCKELLIMMSRNILCNQGAYGKESDDCLSSIPTGQQVSH